MDVDSDLQPLRSNRKRAASSSPAPETGQDAKSAALRAKYTSELDQIGLVPAEQAWDVDLHSVLGDAAYEFDHDHDDDEYSDADVDNASDADGEDDTTAGAEPWPDGRMDGVSEAMMTNLRALSEAEDHPASRRMARPDREMLVLCVLGDLDGHYWLLDALVPVLRTITRDVRFFAIATDVDERRRRLFVERSQVEWAYLSGGRSGSGDARHGTAAGNSGSQDGEIMFVQPGNRARTFTRLGVLHPLGGGREPLDAIVLLERSGGKCKRRLVLPFGWGAGRLVMDEAGGWMVRGKLMEVLREGIEEITREWKGG